MIGRMLLALIGLTVSLAADAQNLRITGAPSDSKVSTVNRLLESTGSQGGDLVGILTDGATIKNDLQKTFPLNSGSLHAVLAKCELMRDQEHLAVSEDAVSVWMNCPSFGHPEQMAPHLIKFSFDGAKVRSAQSITIIFKSSDASAGGNIELNNG